jgi:hypothetical protein
MIKLVTCTWGYSTDFPITNSMLYRSYVKHNTAEHFAHFHYNRGAFYLEEQDFVGRMGTQAEYILFKIKLLKDSIESLDIAQEL